MKDNQHGWASPSAPLIPLESWPLTFCLLCGHNTSNNYLYFSIRWVNINHLAVTHFPLRMRKEPKKKSGLQNVTSCVLLLSSLMSLSANSFRALRRIDDFFLFLFLSHLSRCSWQKQLIEIRSPSSTYVMFFLEVHYIFLLLFKLLFFFISSPNLKIA